MIKQSTKFLLFFLIVFGCTHAINPENSSEIPYIDKRLIELKQHLKELQSSEFNEVVTEQEYMIADWSAYEREIQKFKQIKELERDLQDKIEQLEKRKRELLKQPKSNQ
ncbi:Uncharacterized protein PRO82_001049 [Candidatus Protochlamydia amoebophila]|uniref:hypothetical protein n=1 Tax=Candidatus Protochlamydia amoebophila TaxID=362787 RepID=UPI001BC9258C|nr:hypothetical protein [Candidatus Protochlamydia amoebophila]MBS4163744.1 Uncharacterized protein [Candidatus Protochlamydia amoebophila]